MSVISWRTDINTKILDSTTISIGEGAWAEDSSENGYKQRRAKSLVNSNKFQVTMDFNWLEKDAEGNSEFDRFCNWYKFRHQYGANPFYFESIERFNINGPVVGSDGNPIMCQYRITSAPNFQKSGFCMRCSMTWEEVYRGTILAQRPIFQPDHISAERGKIYVVFTDIPAEYPNPETFLFYRTENLTSRDISDFTKVTIDRCFMNDKQATFITDYETANLPAGNYKFLLGESFDNPNYQIVVTLE